MNLPSPFLASIFPLCFIAPSFANDSAYLASGNQMIPLEETDISVKKEVLTITRINNDEVSVTVDYAFHNPGKEKTILMGFEAEAPKGSVDLAPKKGGHPYIDNFSVTLNDEPTPHKVTILVRDPDSGKSGGKATYTPEDLKKQQPLSEIKDTGVLSNFFYVYHFPATFPTGDSRVIHTYDYAISKGVVTPTSIDYLLTPALRWANKQIDDFTLIIDLGELQQYHIRSTFFENTDQWTTQGRVKVAMEDAVVDLSTDKPSRVMTVWQQKGSITFHAKNFKPQGELSLFANGLANSGDILDSKTMKTSLQCLPLFFDNDHVKDEFTRKVLENIPSARRGYVFKDAELKAFFESQPWYMPDPNYKEGSLPEGEKSWIEKVRLLTIAK